MVALKDYINPTVFPPLYRDESDWTGDKLVEKLASLDPERPSHRRYVQKIQDKLATLIGSTWEGKKFGGVAGVRKETHNSDISVICKSYVSDYRDTEAFLKK